MFDFILQANIRNEYIRIDDPALLSGKNYLRSDFAFSFCSISCFSHNVKESFCFENESIAVFIYGKVFRQNKRISQEIDNPLEPVDIFTDMRERLDFLSLYKGNFCIIIIRKQEYIIHVINDHFALKPVYYLASESQFVVSSNLSFYKLFSKDINYTVVLERLLFSYPISDDTYLKDVKFLDGGEEIEFKNGNFKLESKFDLQQFIFRNDLKKVDINYIVELFNQSVIQRANCSEHLAASLTGGLDGRAIVSVLLKEKREFSTYSFGCKGGENTAIPLNISKVIPEVNYTPFWLDDKYEKEYVKFGLEAIDLSDGLSFFERANYTYTFKMLSKKSRYVLSGLLGGELFGPVNMIGDYINNFYFELFFKNKSLSWGKELTKKSYQVKQEVIEKCRTELDKKILNKKNHLWVLKNQKNGFLFYYYDLLSLGFRRYYGSEIHIERYYAENLTPFLDYDLLDYMFSTQYVEIFKNSFSKNLFSRRNSKLFQSKVICQNAPILGSIKVDRNFKPRELLNPFTRLKIPIMFWYGKHIQRNKKPEFNQGKWNEIFYSSMLQNKLGIFTNFQNKSGIEMNIALSLALWLNFFSDEEVVQNV